MKNVKVSMNITEKSFKNLKVVQKDLSEVLGGIRVSQGQAVSVLIERYMENRKKDEEE